MLRLLYVLLALLLGRFSSCWAQNANYTFCGDCHCINEGEDCPAGDRVPQMKFSPGYVSFLQSLEVTNPYNLSCNPYTEAACETTPPQNMTDLGDAAACGVKYNNMADLSEGQQCPTQYSLVTYASKAEAEANGAHLTHHGACGVCSTTQDLAVYIEFTDLVEKGTECSIRGIIDEEDGVVCYTEVGFTEPCARMWIYNGFNTRDNCLGTCLDFTFNEIPKNALPPACTIADCLLCDEQESGPLFAKVAARSRRRSGLLSTIARPCDAILLVNHTAPCEIPTAPAETSPPTPIMPTSNPSPTTSGGEAAQVAFAVVAFNCFLFGLKT